MPTRVACYLPEHWPGEHVVSLMAIEQPYVVIYLLPRSPPCSHPLSVLPRRLSRG